MKDNKYYTLPIAFLKTEYDDLREGAKRNFRTIGAEVRYRLFIQKRGDEHGHRHKEKVLGRGR